MALVALFQTMVDQSMAIVESIQRTLAGYASDEEQEATQLTTQPDDEPLVIVICDGEITETFGAHKPRAKQGNLNDNTNDGTAPRS